MDQEKKVGRPKKEEVTKDVAKKKTPTKSKSVEKKAAKEIKKPTVKKETEKKTRKSVISKPVEKKAHTVKSAELKKEDVITAKKTKEAVEPKISTKDKKKAETKVVAPIMEEAKLPKEEANNLLEETLSMTNQTEEINAIASTNEKQVEDTKAFLTTKLKLKEKSSFKTYEILFLVVIACVSGILFGLFLNLDKDKKVVEYKDLDPTLKELIKEYEFIKENYAGSLDTEKIISGAVKGMVEAIGDMHSGFIDQVNDQAFNTRLKGTYSGLGIEIINNAEGNIVINKIFKGSPAEQVGLLAGDMITALNGTTMLGVSSSTFSNMVLNDAVGKYTLTISRNNVPQTVVISKGPIEIDSVTSKMIERNDKKIGYLQVDIFAENTTKQFQEQLNSLEAQGMDSLVIDLRGNSGGHLSVVHNMISLFLDSSKVIYQTQTKGEIQKFHSSGTQNKTYSIALLGDQMSASASEIMIGALTEQLSATLVGKKTYGKGTVQEVKTLTTGDQYKVTTKNWLTSNGKTIDGVGITPNIEVDLSAAYFENPSDNTDNQLQSALEVLSPSAR